MNYNNEGEEDGSSSAIALDYDDDDNDNNNNDDFPLIDEEYKEDYFDTKLEGRESKCNHTNTSNNNNNDAWVQLLNLPPNLSSTSGLAPVGGMRRVSSCYFSIASNLSADNNSPLTSFHSPNPSYHNTSSSATFAASHHYDALSFDGRTTSNYLLHDVLMNVFSFLDAQSLASFSETAKRPNFEVFYFLELQLQRALLVGDNCGFDNGEGGGDENEGEDESIDDGEGSNNNERGSRTTESDSSSSISSSINSNSNSAIPSFEGSIAGTGVISRLASLNSTLARKIVQTYLDSNTSINALPLSHSLAYFRQLLLRHRNKVSAKNASSSTAAASAAIPENMAKNARNMAIFFTFVGAAYMQSQGDVPAIMPTMPDPSEVLNEENMEILKNMMLKGFVAGGFIKAGKTMKEKVADINAAQASGEASSDDVAGRHEGEGLNVQNNNDTMQGGGDANAQAGEVVAVGNNNRRSSRQPQQRSSSIGSLEDLSQMLPHPSTIASRLYSAFSNKGSSPNTSTANLDTSSDEMNNSLAVEDQIAFASSPARRRHRSKRSHTTIRHSDIDEGDESNDTSEGRSEEKEPNDDDSDAITNEEKGDENISSPLFHNEEQKTDEALTPEEIAYAMDHPFSPDPYEHGGNGLINDDVAAASATSFFSFNGQKESTSHPLDSGNIPTGCVGAYAHAVRSAASALTRLIKEERKSNFDALSPDEQQELGARFMDACTSDNKLNIVKDIVQKQKKMDVDRCK